MKIRIKEEVELIKITESIIPMIEENKVVFLYGDLGAGKTTFVKSLLGQLGSIDEASSPTYSLVNEYQLDNKKFYHIDLYRLNNTEEAIDIGIEDYLYSGDLVFIEWPQIIESIIEDALAVKIQSEPDGSRVFEISKLSQSVN